MMHTEELICNAELQKRSKIYDKNCIMTTNKLCQ